MNERLYTREETAELFKVGARTIDRWIRIGALRRANPPGAVRIPASEIERLMTPLEPLPFDEPPLCNGENC